MPQENSLPTDEIIALSQQCQVIIDETQKQDTLLSRARRYEFRNLRSVLLGLLDCSEFFRADKKMEQIFERTRERIQKLIDDPESAGSHEHMLCKQYE